MRRQTRKQTKKVVLTIRSVGRVEEGIFSERKEELNYFHGPETLLLKQQQDEQKD